MSGAAIAAAAAGAAVSGGIGAASSGKGGKTAKPSQLDQLYANPQFQMQVATDAADHARGLDRFSTKGPGGSVSWDPTTNTQVTNLSPEQWQLYGSQTAAQQRAIDLAGQQAGQLSSTLGSPLDKGDMAQRQHVEGAMMDRLNPYLERDQQSLEQKLANQGLQPGGEAYTNAMMDQNRRVNDARLGVIGQGTQEMQATQGMSNAARNQALSENAALMQQSGQVNVPTYTGNSGQGQAVPNAAGIFQNYSQNARNDLIAEQNQRNASANQAGSAGAGFGDALSKALMNSNKFKGLFPNG